jgi:hypothetical protein
VLLGGSLGLVVSHSRNMGKPCLCDVLAAAGTCCRFCLLLSLVVLFGTALSYYNLIACGFE